MTGSEGKYYLHLASTTTNPSRQVILLKFSRQYGKEVHQFCTSISQASSTSLNMFELHILANRVGLYRVTHRQGQLVRSHPHLLL
jgi:predicted HicB family RNase H-like nuclease